MKWLKKQFNKLFIAEEEYEKEQIDFEELEIGDEQTSQHPPKKKFVFPLVDDYEQFNKKTITKQPETNFPIEEKLSLPNHLKQDGGISEVYEVEVSGIRELLERRRSGPGRNFTHRDSMQTRLKRPAFEKKPISYDKTDMELTKEEPSVKRKKFVPTKVPSPVYGFAMPKKKESSIIHSGKTYDEVQLEKKSQSPNKIVREDDIQLQQEAINIVEQHELHTSSAQQKQMDVDSSNIESKLEPFYNDIAESSESSILDQDSDDKIAEEYDKSISNEIESSCNNEKEKSIVQKIDSSSMNVGVKEEQTKVIEIVEQSSFSQGEIEDWDSIQTDKVTFHNSTVHIENLTITDTQVEQILQNEQEAVEPLAEDLQETLEVSEELPRSETRSKLPFNVLMLKSDKEKLAAKKKNEQIIENSFAQMPATTIVESNVDSLRTVPKQYFQSSSQEDIEELKGILGISEVEHYEENNQLKEIQQHNFLENADFEQSSDELTLNNEEEANSLKQIASTMLIDSTEMHMLKDREKSTSYTEEKDHRQQQKPLEEAEELVDEIKPENTEQKLTMAFTNELLNEPLPYNKPPLSILAPPEEMLEDTEWMEEQGENLVEALSHFQVQAHVESVVQGPAVTQFEITVGHGTKVSKVRNLSDDIQLALAARDIRIDAPIPGKRSIGIEIPNRVSRPVRLSEVTNSDRFQKSDSPLEAALGLDLNGNPVTLDLRKMPHGLIAGATGSGKSVCINSILVSLLYKSAPHELKLMLIDPKMVELAPFNHIPHLVSPVITDVKAATESLKWAVDEMERRYQLFMHSGTRDITRYNKLCDENKMYAQKLPYLLIVIDELADLMMMSPADVELAISRLAQKARACGIHLILATQRPSVDVITGTLKSNIPTRIAFAVSSSVDSRTIIDQQGAERLLGRGDMLYLGNGMNAPQRIQGTFVTDEEIEEVVEYVRSQGEPNYFFKSEELVQKSETIEEQDELFEEVCRFVYSQGSASTSALQRRYHIGYNRAARLIDMLEGQGFISEQKGSKPRDVYITETMLEDMFS